ERGTTFGARRHESVRRACRARAGARLGDVADAECRTAFGAAGHEHVDGARPARAGAGLRDVARTAGSATLGADGHEGVGWTGVGDTVAQLRHVARPDRRTAHAPALHVRRAQGGRPGADLRRIAAAAGRTADGAAHHERIGGAVVADAVAALRDVAHARRRATDRRALHVRRTCGVRARTALGDVARARRRAAHGARRRERIRGARVGDAVAALGDVARPGRRPAHGPALQIGRARGGRTRAVLRGVARARRAAADRARGCEGVRGAGVADTVAAFGEVARAGRRPANGRALGVGGAEGAGTAARLRHVAPAGRGTAHGPRGYHGVRRAGVGHA